MDVETFLADSKRLHDAEQRARALHWDTTVVLGYNNIPLHITEGGFDCSPILGHGSLCATNLDRLILGGIKVIVWSPGVPYWTTDGRYLFGREKVDFLLQQLEAVNELSKLTDGVLQVARNAEEIRTINANRGIAVLLHLSGVNHLNDMGVLREYYDMGVRMVHCAFQDCRDDQHPVEHHYHPNELDENGIRTIEEMKRLGIIVDMAHIMPAGFDDIASRMEGIPFVYSHGGCHALVQQERNLDDERIATVVASGGVYGIGVYIDPFAQGGIGAGHSKNEQVFKELGEGRIRRQKEMEASSASVREFISKRYCQTSWDNWGVKELQRLGGYNVRSSIHNIVGQMSYLRDQFGPAAVGFGPDFEFTFGYVAGLEEADKTPNLTRELLAAGFSEQDTQAAMGHNFMRVFETVLR